MTCGHAEELNISHASDLEKKQPLLRHISALILYIVFLVSTFSEQVTSWKHRFTFSSFISIQTDLKMLGDLI